MHERPKGFSYTKTHQIYVSYWKDGSWDQGNLVDSDDITVSAMSTSLHYAQECFEGLKAYRRKDGRIQLFRVEDNAKRFQMSASFMMMPVIDVERFIEAVKMTVKANEDFVPPYGLKDTLYIRPFMIGVGQNLGLRPAKEYMFVITTSPVGPYFSGTVKPVNLVVSEYDRAAPHGTGHVKVGGNYAASLFAQASAIKKGFSDCLFLDPATHTKIEEVGAANFFGITRNNEYITPKSPSILNSITNRSLKHLAKHALGLDVIEGDIFIDKLDDLVEAGACGTAAVITPIASITHNEHQHVFPASTDFGHYSKKLYDLLTSIQFGDSEDNQGWITIL